MRDAIYAKFTQHDALRNQLLATQGIQLVELSHGDAFWGNGGNGRGQNRLGHLLMELRDELARGSPGSSSGDEASTAAGADDGKKNKSHTTNAEKVEKRKRRQRGRKNVWKDNTGDSKFEIDNENPTQAVLFGDSSITVPLSVLPEKALRVVRRHQYVKKFDGQQAMIDSDDDGLGEDDGDESPATRADPHAVRLAAFMPASATSAPAPPASHVAIKGELLIADTCLAVAKDALALLQTLSPMSPDYAAAHAQLKEWLPYLSQFVAETTNEGLMIELLGIVDQINAL